MVSRIAACFLLAMYLQLLFFQLYTHSYLVADDDDEEEPEMSFWVALGGLCFVTALVSLYSDWLVSSIDGFTESSGISKTFVGLIIIPVVGNAVEHITAVTVACKNKMDLSMGVAVGSSSQVSLFVVPFIVLYGWAKDIDMTLNFPHFEIMLYILAVIIVTNCVMNGKSNWLEGSLLISTYLMIAVGFWYEKVKEF
jgi:Ca2+:H+ antiporter